MNNILVLIPARGGSKRLPEKNKKYLGNKMLINWTIDLIKNIEGISKIIVSTDDADIAEIAQQKKVLVPWLRPAHLSTDEASSVDVAIHALEWYKSTYNELIDGLLLLQPTSPFRTISTIKQGIKLFYDHNMKPVIAVSPVKEHPFWCMKIESELLFPLEDSKRLQVRSQELPAVFIVNGSFYLIRPQDLYHYKTFAPRESVPLIITSPKESLDIDTTWDWKLAEFWLKNEY